MSKMIVIYHKPGICTLNENLILKPGANEVSVKDFEPYEKHPTILKYVDDGIIEFKMPTKAGASGDSGDGGGSDVEQHLKGKNVKESIALVQATADANLLAAWLKVEERKTVKEALEKQIKSLSDAPVLRNDPNASEKVGGVTVTGSQSAASETLTPDFSGD